MYLLVITYSAYKKRKTRNQMQKHEHWLESTSWKYFETKNQMKWTMTKTTWFFFGKSTC